MLHENINTAHHPNDPTSSLIRTNHLRISKESVVEQQYLPKVPVPVQHIATFYSLVT